MQEGITSALGADSRLRSMTGIDYGVIGQYHKFGMDAIH